MSSMPNQSNDQVAALERRLTAVEELLARLEAQHVSALGEALFASSLVPFLLMAAVQSGSIDLEMTREVLDRTMLSAEGQRASSEVPEAIAYLRQRLESQLLALDRMFGTAPALM
jgi:hypothetical protein